MTVLVPASKLSLAERTPVLDVLDSDEFVDKPPSPNSSGDRKRANAHTTSLLSAASARELGARSWAFTGNERCLVVRSFYAVGRGPTSAGGTKLLGYERLGGRMGQPVKAAIAAAWAAPSSSSSVMGGAAYVLCHPRRQRCPHIRRAVRETARMLNALRSK